MLAYSPSLSEATRHGDIRRVLPFSSHSIVRRDRRDDLASAASSEGAREVDLFFLPLWEIFRSPPGLHESNRSDCPTEPLFLLFFFRDRPGSAVPDSQVRTGLFFFFCGVCSIPAGPVCCTRHGRTGEAGPPLFFTKSRSSL